MPRISEQTRWYFREWRAVARANRPNVSNYAVGAVIAAATFAISLWAGDLDSATLFTAVAALAILAFVVLKPWIMAPIQIAASQRDEIAVHRDSVVQLKDKVRGLEEQIASYERVKSARQDVAGAFGGFYALWSDLKEMSVRQSMQNQISIERVRGEIESYRYRVTQPLRDAGLNDEADIIDRRLGLVLLVEDIPTALEDWHRIAALIHHSSGMYA